MREGSAEVRFHFGNCRERIGANNGGLRRSLNFELAECCSGGGGGEHETS